MFISFTRLIEKASTLLNYIEIRAISSLVGFLSDYCRPEALLFALIFDLKEMPEDMTVYSVVDESHLAYEYGGAGMRICPRHQPRSLSLAVPDFSVFDSFRLRTGMVEYIYRYKGKNLQERNSPPDSIIAVPERMVSIG